MVTTSNGKDFFLTPFCGFFTVVSYVQCYNVATVIVSFGSDMLNKNTRGVKKYEAKKNL